jgi:hypothetical protein
MILKLKKTKTERKGRHYFHYSNGAASNMAIFPTDEIKEDMG